MLVIDRLIEQFRRTPEKPYWQERQEWEERVRDGVNLCKLVIIGSKLLETLKAGNFEVKPNNGGFPDDYPDGLNGVFICGEVPTVSLNTLRPDKKQPLPESDSEFLSGLEIWVSPYGDI